MQNYGQVTTSSAFMTCLQVLNALFSVWNGVIFIRQGLYQEAVFRFNLNIPENYPNADCPVSIVNILHNLLHTVLRIFYNRFS